MTDGTCIHDGCDSGQYAHGLCQPHYSEARRWAGGPCQTDGCPRPAIDGGALCGHCRRSARAAAPKGPCSVEGCDREVSKKGKCEPHYRAEQRASSEPCSVDGCDTNRQVRGMCLKHYHRMRRHGSPDVGDDTGPAPLGACSVEGCDDTVKSRGMCGKHYAADQRSKYGTCTVDGCDNGATNRQGMCAKHYARKLKYGTTDEPPARRKMDLTCSVEGCDKVTRARGYCAGHWARWRKHGTTDLPEPPTTFYCRRCNRTLPREQYSAAEGGCLDCAAKHARNRRVFRAYRVFAEDADKQEAHQGFMCAICGLPSQDSLKRLAVDHCHDTGQMRGRLCSDCNLGLGKFHDDPHILEIAAAYLRAYKPA